MGASVGLDDVDLAEARGAAAVAHAVDLRRFALAVVGRAVLLPVGRSGDGVAGLPEIGGARLIGDAGDHSGLLSLLDFPEGVAAELEVVALLIDGEAAVAIDQDAVFDAGDQVVERGPGLAGFEPDVRHTLEGHAGPAIGVAAAARFLFADQGGLVADGLVVLEDALFDDGEARGLDAVVVVADGGEAPLVGAVAPDVDQVAADAFLAQLVGGEEAGAGVVGLVAQRAIEFGGVADGFVDGEPEVAGQQDQVLLAGGDGRRLQVFDHFFADALGVFDQVHDGDEFVAGGDGRRLESTGLGEAFGQIDGGGIDDAVGLQVELLNAGTHRGGEVLVLLAEGQGAAGGEDLLRFLGFGGGAADQLQLLLDRDFEGVALVRGLPVVGVSRDRRQHDGLVHQRGIGFGDLHGFAGDARDFLGLHERRRGEAPGAVDDHANAEAEAAAIADARDFEGLAGAALGVEADAEELLPGADDADIAIGRLEFLGFGEADGAEFGEFGIGFPGAGGSGEEARGEGRSAGIKEGTSAEHKTPWIY